MDTIFSHFNSFLNFSAFLDFSVSGFFSSHTEYILSVLLATSLFFVFILFALVQNLREQISELVETHKRDVEEMEREVEEQLREIEREVEEEIEKEIELGLGKELEETVKRCVLQCLDQFFTEKEKRENEELLKKYLNSEEDEDAPWNPREEENSFMLRFSDTEDEDAPWNEEDAMEEEATSRKEKNSKEEDEDEDTPWNEEDAMEENSVKLYENIKKEYREKNPRWLADKYTNLPKGKVLDVSRYTKEGKIVRVMRSPLKRPLLKSKKIQVPGMLIVSNSRPNLINALQDLGYTDPHIEDWLVLWDGANDGEVHIDDDEENSKGKNEEENSSEENEEEENSKGKEEEDDEEENSEESSEESNEESSSDNYDEEHPSDEDFDTDDLGERLESLRGIRRKDKDTKEEIASLNEYLNVK